MPFRTRTLYLPNGCSYVVSPIFGGMVFKNTRKESDSSIPSGWSIVVNTDKPLEDVAGSRRGSPAVMSTVSDDAGSIASSRASTPRSNSGNDLQTRFIKPTLNRDSLFISSLSLPSNENSQVTVSRTRLVAAVLWITLWWYFHLAEPDPADEPDGGEILSDSDPSEKVKRDWRVYIRPEGVLKGRNVLQKLERMGLIASEESSVGLDGHDVRYPAGWSHMFVSRRSFWQLDPRIFLFVMDPAARSNDASSAPSAPSASSSELSSRPSSSSISQNGYSNQAGILAAQYPGNPPSSYYSSSNFPTFYPPPPPQYTKTNGIRHPIRPKPPRQGEVFYNHYIPSVEQTFALRVPILPPKVSPLLEKDPDNHRKSNSVTALPATTPLNNEAIADSEEDDLGVLHRWMNNPRVNSTWGMAGPRPAQEHFLQKQLTGRHSFPAYGCFDGKPFGYFEIYWMKEDQLGRKLPVPPGNWDRGLRYLIGEDDFVGSRKVQIWLSSLVHYCWLADNRTQSVISNPKAKNYRDINLLRKAGFQEDGEVDTPQGRAIVMKINREDWESPEL